MGSILARVGKRFVSSDARGETITVEACSTVRAAPCPACHRWSNRLHGSYVRRLEERPSGFIMHSFGGLGGHAGWQWLFITEALPAIALGIIMGSYAIGFWQPTIIKSSGVDDPLTVGLLTVIPYSCALVSMFLVARHADKTRERRWHVSAPALIAAIGFCICAFSGHQLVPAMIGLSLATAGIISGLPMFWALPTSFLGGAGAAAGIALINSTANLAGFVSPSIIGWLRTEPHSLTSGLFLVAGCLTLSALLALLLN